MFEQIEKLKREFTDQYVVVEADRPELARFEGYTGRVKTVNMSGRALVQFDAWNNIAWYDIDVGSLRVVPKPDENAAAEPKKAPKAAVNAKQDVVGEKKVSAVEAARQQGAAKKPAGKASTADILAAARAKGGTAPDAGAKAKPSTADILAAARAKGGTGSPAPAAKPAAKPAAAPPAGKMSTADILAAARAKKAAAEPAAEKRAIGEAADQDAEAPASAEAVLSAPAKRSAPIGAAPTSTAEKIAWCRTHDAK